MIPNPASRRLSLDPQLGMVGNPRPPSDFAVKNKSSMPNMRSDDSPQADIKPPRQTSSAVRTRRSPTLSSLLGLKGNSPALVPPQVPQHRLVMARLPKKARQMSSPNLISSELDVKDVNVQPEFATVKGPSRIMRIPRASISTAAQIRPVEDMELPLPPTMLQKNSQTPHESDGRSSNTSSIYRNSSNSHPSLRAPTGSLGPPITSISANLAQNEDQGSFSSFEHPPLPNPIANDTAESPKTTMKQRRRMSFDFASLKRAASTTPSPQAGVDVQRSQSLWRHKMGSAGCELEQSAVSQLQEHMSGRQRALNVKRARKMTQYFGTEPPSSLFQITNLDDNDDDDDDDISVSPVEGSTGDSLANLLSSLTPLRTSFTHSRTSLVLTDSSENNKIDELKSARPPTPPFVLRSESDPPKSPTLSFKTRRRRAAKLAQFFGVGYHDLSESMGHPVVASLLTSNEDAESWSRPPRVLPASSVEVDIKMSGPARFWGMVDGRKNMTDASMNDVIGRLREMKAS